MLFGPEAADLLNRYWSCVWDSADTNCSLLRLYCLQLYSSDVEFQGFSDCFDHILIHLFLSCFPSSWIDQSQAKLLHGSRGYSRLITHLFEASFPLLLLYSTDLVILRATTFHRSSGSLPSSAEYAKLTSLRPQSSTSSSCFTCFEWT